MIKIIFRSYETSILGSIEIIRLKVKFKLKVKF